MTGDLPNRNPLKPTSEELATLELRWVRGELSHHVANLLAFVEQEREEILHLAGGHRETGALLEATRRMIAELRSIHPRTEMHDQMREIHNEIWFRGERGEHDRDRIKHEWTSRHAANWRRWRILEYLYVADRCAEEIARRFAAG